MNGHDNVTAAEQIERLDGINRVADAVLTERVRLHADRREKLIGVATYLAGLQAVRAAEATLEVARRQHGATASRALELSLDEAMLNVAGLIGPAETVEGSER